MSGTMCAQTVETKLSEIIPPSPQAAQFMRYGEIPVGHTTGIPQIDIPVYTLSTGWIDIPISLSYHASGFRVSEIPSSVGLGWVLNAGGWLISRSIEVKPDFEGYDSMPITSAEQVDSLKNGTKLYNYAANNWIDFSQYQKWEAWQDFFFDNYSSSTPLFDTRSDRYFYSLPGSNGIARFNVETKELMPIPYTPIKIERISSSLYRVTDTKGIKYEYTEAETVFVNGKGKIINAWYLTKIVSPGMEEVPVVFSYKKGSEYVESNKYETTSIVDARNITNNGENSVNCPTSELSSQSSMNSTTYNSPLIETISYKNTTIRFNYSTDRLDLRKDRLTSITVMSNNVSVKNILLDNNVYFGNTSKNYRLKLKGITFKDGSLNASEEKYSFNYYNEESAAPIYYSFQSGTHCCEDYWGYYNGKESNAFFPKDINWEQAIGISDSDVTSFQPYKSLKQYVASGLYSGDRSPSENYMKYFVLKEITYPTKGRTLFEYEINKVSAAYEFSQNNEVGGLRVKKRINYSDENSIAETKTWEYNGYATEPIKNSYYAYRTSYIDYYASLFASNPDRYQFYKIEYPVFFFVGTPYSNLAGWTGSNVFYDKITEYTSENNSYIGRIVYNYTEESRNFNNECYYNLDEYLPSMISKISDCDKGNINSLLLSSVFYNQDGDLVKKIENKYALYAIPPLHTGVKVWQNATYPTNWFYNSDGKSFQKRLDISASKQSEYNEYYINRIYAINTYAHRDIMLLSSTTEAEYVKGELGTSKTVAYDYDLKNGVPILFTPSSQRQINSDDILFQESKKFPFSDKYKNIYPYDEMVTKNILSPVVEKITIKDGKESIVQTDYIKDMTRTKNLILPDKIRTSFSGGNNLRNDIIYDYYDAQGNILQLTSADGVSTVYLWSYNYEYPILEIRNATYAEVKSVVNYNDAQLQNLAIQPTPSSTLILQLGESLRNNLPNSLVTTCIYKPLVGLLSKVTPDGKLTYYEYDSFGRLFCVKDQDMKVIEQYEYHYKP